MGDPSVHLLCIQQCLIVVLTLPVTTGWLVSVWSARGGENLRELVGYGFGHVTTHLRATSTSELTTLARRSELVGTYARNMTRTLPSVFDCLDAIGMPLLYSSDRIPRTACNDQSGESRSLEADAREPSRNPALPARYRPALAM
jgi:hypothetical protein